MIPKRSIILLVNILNKPKIRRILWLLLSARTPGAPEQIALLIEYEIAKTSVKEKLDLGNKMTSKERILRTIRGEKTDRVPI